MISKALCTPTFTSESNSSSKNSITTDPYYLQFLLIIIYLTFSKRVPSACFPLPVLHAGSSSLTWPSPSHSLFLGGKGATRPHGWPVTGTWQRDT